MVINKKRVSCSNRFNRFGLIMTLFTLSASARGETVQENTGLSCKPPYGIGLSRVSENGQVEQRNPGLDVMKCNSPILQSKEDIANVQSYISEKLVKNLKKLKLKVNADTEKDGHRSIQVKASRLETLINSGKSPLLFNTVIKKLLKQISCYTKKHFIPTIIFHIQSPGVMSMNNFPHQHEKTRSPDVMGCKGLEKMFGSTEGAPLEMPKEEVKKQTNARVNMMAENLFPSTTQRPMVFSISITNEENQVTEVITDGTFNLEEDRGFVQLFEGSTKTSEKATSNALCGFSGTSIHTGPTEAPINTRVLIVAVDIPDRAFPHLYRQLIEPNDMNNIKITSKLKKAQAKCNLKPRNNKFSQKPSQKKRQGRGQGRGRGEF